MAATGAQFVTRSRIVAFAAGMLWLAAHDVLADGTGFFSSAQLSQGRWEYSQKCSVCHGAQLQGGGAPALKGSEFSALWNGKTLKDFYDYVQANMPLGQGAALKGQEYADIVAYILAQVGLPSGNEKLTPATPMDRVLDMSAAPTAGSAAVDASSGEVKIGELYGTLSQPTTNRPTQAELDAADASTSDWLMFNKGYRGERFSTLRRINAGNAGKLKPVCMFQLGELGTFSTGPVVYDGIPCATTHLGTYAIDATTCKKVWSHQHVAQGPEMNATNKGVAIAGGRVFRGTQDGFLGLANGWGSNDPVGKWSGWINAVDPRTGKMAWRVHTPVPMYAALTPTAGDVLFTGDLDGNFLVLNARTGKEIYRFDTGGPIAGGVVTYEQKGRQYVAVASGSSGGSIPLTGSATIVIFGQ